VILGSIFFEFFIFLQIVKSIDFIRFDRIFLQKNFFVFAKTSKIANRKSYKSNIYAGFKAFLLLFFIFFFIISIKANISNKVLRACRILIL